MKFLFLLNLMVDYWVETGKMYSSLIDKPKMIEKLLKRPPPKYVYHIILNTMRKTGFPWVLITIEEENDKYFESDAHHKFDILKKAIDITKIANNENFYIKCTNVLQGTECERTNYFLQSFYKAATSGKDYSGLNKKYLRKTREKKINPQKDNAINNQNIWYPKNKEEELLEKVLKLSEEEKLNIERRKEEEKQYNIAIKNSEKENYKNNNNYINKKKENEEEEEYDEFYGICPITQEYMNNLVLCPSRHYYEKSAIINWIKKENTDPLTRERLTIDMLIEDEEYKKKIIEYRKKYNK